ncbi:transposase [Candidatus Micrarchaeota archaeon]|nr:transposase [Candidatus Micrarchaeota archaeon]
MLVQATIRLNVPPSRELIDTMVEFSKATQFAYNYAVKNKIRSWKILHQKTYRKIRAFSKLPSQLSCKAIKYALETKKGCRNRKVNFSKELSIRYDHRSYSFDFSGICSLSTIYGRIRQTLYVPEYYLRTYRNWEIRSATLSKSGKHLSLNITVTRNVDVAAHTSNNKVIGIDLGINNLATTSEKQFFKGVKDKLANFQRLKSRLQSKGTASARRHLKKLSGRQTRFMRSINHEISKLIVSRANAGDIIVLEDLYGIRDKSKGRALNRLISNWAFYQLKNFIEYKTLRKGAIFISIPSHHSSKTCSRCNETYTKRPKNAGFFKCLNCGYSCNADLNASLNLRGRTNVLRNVLGLLVNQPIVAEDYISLAASPCF